MPRTRSGGPELYAETPEALLDGLASHRDPGRSTSDTVYRMLREAVLSGVLPPGTRLGEEKLARELKVSRTPVREAVLRLESEGFAERAPNRGLAVAAVTHDEILELYVVRAALDGLAGQLAAQGAAASDLMALKWINAKMREASEDKQWAEMVQLNLSFHETLARAGHNHVLLELVRSIHDRVRRFPGTTFSVGGRASGALTEHDAIVEAVEARDGALAEDLARRHMAAAMDVRIAMLLEPGLPST